MNVLVGSLWLKDKKDGSGKFYSGVTGPVSIPPNAYLSIFKNEKKEKDNQPDYFLYVNDDMKKKEEAKPAAVDPLGDIPF